MHKTIGKILRIFLVFLGIYLTCEALLAFFNIRLIDINNIWLTSATVFSHFIGFVLGSMFLFAAVMVLEIQRDLLKYKSLVVLSSFWALFHGGLLIYLSFAHDYLKIYQNMSSLFIWIPFYNQFLILEGTVLIIYSILVWVWAKK